ncbi:MAG: peptidyl-prolyl cis-trans isomerase [Saprospiraceae bacterium]|nr:peptidyl-prolyl cis-trans isomerase [Saprospiraceae bacterium]
MMKFFSNQNRTAWRGILALIGCICLWQCGQKATEKKDDKILAKVYDRNLYLSELEGIVPEQTPAADSALLISAYVQRWIREQLMMYEAERNIPKDLNIDELVRNYRASLVRYNFEEKLIAEKLDSTVSNDELLAYYELNKDQFQLESTILKCLLLKVPTEAPQNEINKLWYSRNAADETRLNGYAKQWASLALLDKEKWYTLQELAALLPKGTLTTDNVSSRRDGTVSDGDFRYYYRVMDVVQGKTTAPFDYAREQALKIIQHRRKQELLDKWKEELYQKELRRENIKIMQ